MTVGLQRLANAGAEPVTLAQMKAHLNLETTFTDDDDLISGMISAAREDAEDVTGQSFISQQWMYVLDGFPVRRILDAAPSRSDTDVAGNYNFSGGWSLLESQVISLPVPPLMSVDLLQYAALANAGVMTTLDPLGYQVDTISTPGRLAPAAGTTWPILAPGILNAVQITFTSGGYAAAPFRVLQAIKLRAAAYYANREEFIAGVPIGKPDWFERMLSLDRKSIFGVVR